MCKRFGPLHFFLDGALDGGFILDGLEEGRGGGVELGDFGLDGVTEGCGEGEGGPKVEGEELLIAPKSPVVNKRITNKYTSFTRTSKVHLFLVSPIVGDAR
jgi:hypothetical protein